MNRNMRIVALVFLVILLLFPGCRKDANPEGEKEGPLKIAFTGPPTTLNPIRASEASSREIVDILYRGLIDWNDQWEPYPEVARRVPAFSNGGIIKKGNSLLITYEIDRTARWSNGIYIEPGDFIFYNRMAAFPVFAELTAEWRERIKNISIAENYFMIITWMGLDIGSMRYLKPLPREILEGEITKNPMNFFKEPLKWQKVVNGPYEIQDAKIKNEQIVNLRLVRNDEYTKKKPAIKYVIVTFFNTKEAFESDIFAGNFDIIAPLSFEQGKQLSKNKEYNVFFTPNTTLLCATMDTQSEMLADRDIRLALILSIKREELVKKLFEDRGSAAQSWLPAQHPAYLPVFKKLDFNQRKAIELLKKAGWKREKGEYWKKGDKILTLRVASGNDPAERAALLFLKESWERLGAKIEEIKTVKKPSLNGKEDSQDVTVTSLDISPWVNPSSIFSSRSPETNLAQWVSQENDKICSEYNQEIALNKKHESLKTQQMLVARELPLIPLVFMLNVSASRKTITHFSPRGFGNCTWNIEYWERNETPLEK